MSVRAPDTRPDVMFHWATPETLAALLADGWTPVDPPVTHPGAQFTCIATLLERVPE